MDYNQTVASNDRACLIRPDEKLKEYIFCKDTCAKPQHECQLKKEFQDGWITERCKQVQKGETQSYNN